MAVRVLRGAVRQPREVGDAALDVVREVVGVQRAADDVAAQPAGGGRHELHHADGADARDGALAPAALLPGDGPREGRGRRRSGPAWLCSSDRDLPRPRSPPDDGAVPGTRSTRPDADDVRVRDAVERRQGLHADAVAGGDGAERVARAHRVAAGRGAAPARGGAAPGGDREGGPDDDQVRVRDAVGPCDGRHAGAVARGDRAEGVAGAHGDRAALCGSGRHAGDQAARAGQRRRPGGASGFGRGGASRGDDRHS